MRFRIRRYVAESLWVPALLGIVLGVLLSAVDMQVDKSIHLPAAWTYSASTATTVLSAIVGAMAALTGFVVTVTLLVARMVIGTFSARFICIGYRDPMLKAILAVLIGAFVFAFSLLRRVENNFVPNLGVTTAGLLVVVSLLLFAVFLSRNLDQLRPSPLAPRTRPPPPPPELPPPAPISTARTPNPTISQSPSGLPLTAKHESSSVGARPSWSIR